MPRKTTGRPAGQRRGKRYQPMSEINVTPFVDVMLVLLIVFMVTAPLLTVGVQVDLPETKAQALAQPSEPLVISVDEAGAVFVRDAPTDDEALVDRLVELTGNDPRTRIFIRGDRAIDYGRVMEVMGQVNSAGFTRVALIAQAPSAASDSP
ncbi:MAG: protein TolR [Pseudomonadota bacterium]